MRDAETDGCGWLPKKAWKFTKNKMLTRPFGLLAELGRYALRTLTVRSQ
jgi:hypothetical protein